MPRQEWKFLPRLLNKPVDYVIAVCLRYVRTSSHRCICIYKVGRIPLCAQCTIYVPIIDLQPFHWLWFHVVNFRQPFFFHWPPFFNVDSSCDALEFVEKTLYMVLLYPCICLFPSQTYLCASECVHVVENSILNDISNMDVTQSECHFHSHFYIDDMEGNRRFVGQNERWYH